MRSMQNVYNVNATADITNRQTENYYIGLFHRDKTYSTTRLIHADISCRYFMIEPFYEKRKSISAITLYSS